MPPQLAVLACTLFILGVLWADRRRSPEASWALWIPLIWMLLAGSRLVSQWLDLGTPIAASVEAYDEGSPLDRNILALLIFAGLVVLLRRRLAWGKLIKDNKWIWLFFLLGGVSFLWSDDPIVTMKRLLKAMGNLVMALVILTDKRPTEAVGLVLRRMGYILLPLSVLLIRYFPEIGRTYSQWTYEPMFTGVAQQKNGLGQICLISGIYYLWTLLVGRDKSKEGGGPSTFLSVIFLVMIAWLLRMADSATSLACLGIAVSIMFVSRVPAFARSPRKVIAVGLAVLCLVGILEATLDISSLLLGLLGRDPTLTERVPMWQALIRVGTNPMLGAGYGAFWTGARMQAIWDELGFAVIQAHNGYLDVYLNLGLIGLFIIVAGMLSGVLKAVGWLEKDHRVAVLRLSFVMVVIIYNWTEATFNGINNMWLLFFLGSMDTPMWKLRPSPAASTSETGLESEGRPQLESVGIT